MGKSSLNLVGLNKRRYDGEHGIYSIEGVINEFFSGDTNIVEDLSLRKLRAPKPVKVFCDGLGRDSFATLSALFKKHPAIRRFRNYVKNGSSGSVLRMHADTGCEQSWTYVYF